MKKLIDAIETLKKDKLSFQEYLSVRNQIKGGIGAEKYDEVYRELGGDTSHLDFIANNKLNKAIMEACNPVRFISDIVYYKDGFAVVTDNMRLAQFKIDYPKGFECRRVLLGKYLRKRVSYKDGIRKDSCAIDGAFGSVKGFAFMCYSNLLTDKAYLLGKYNVKELIDIIKKQQNNKDEDFLLSREYLKEVSYDDFNTLLKFKGGVTYRNNHEEGVVGSMLTNTRYLLSSLRIFKEAGHKEVEIFLPSTRFSDGEVDIFSPPAKLTDGMVYATNIIIRGSDTDFEIIMGKDGHKRVFDEIMYKVSLDKEATLVSGFKSTIKTIWGS